MKKWVASLFHISNNSTIVDKSVILFPGSIVHLYAAEGPYEHSILSHKLLEDIIQ